MVQHVSEVDFNEVVLNYEGVVLVVSGLLGVVHVR